MFKPDWSRLPDKRFEALMFINCIKDFKHLLFLFNQYFKAAVAKLFGCWAKFAILSASVGRTILRYRQKTKQKNTRITFVTFVHCNLFFCLVTCLKCVVTSATASFLHNTCNMWFYAWCCNTLLLQFSRILYSKPFTD